MQNLSVNGQTKTFAVADFPMTLAALVTAMGLQAEVTVAEVDGEIIPQNRFSDYPIQPDSRIELVQFVGGG